MFSTWRGKAVLVLNALCQYKTNLRKEIFKKSWDRNKLLVKEKEKNIKEMAEKYFKDRLITENIYNAMISYKVDIND